MKRLMVAVLAVGAIALSACGHNVANTREEIVSALRCQSAVDQDTVAEEEFLCKSDLGEITVTKFADPEAAYQWAPIWSDLGMRWSAIGQTGWTLIGKDLDQANARTGASYPVGK